MSNTELVIPDDLAPTATLWGTDNPVEVITRAANVAKPLAELVRKQNLIVRIGASDYPKVEAWTLLGSMLGVFPFVEWTRPVGDGDAAGWEARVEARTRSGEVVGAAEAECLRSERTWKGRDDYALRSMAQTRAVSKALRLPLGFVMQLAGFDPTPAEEMPVIEVRTAEAHETEDDGLFPPPADAPISDVPLATKAQATLIVTKANQAGLDDDARHALIETITGQPSSKQVPKVLVNTVLAEIAKHAAAAFEIPAGARE